jgi:hypothetical protein
LLLSTLIGSWQRIVVACNTINAYMWRPSLLFPWWPPCVNVVWGTLRLRTTCLLPDGGTSNCWWGAVWKRGWGSNNRDPRAS